MTDRHISRDVAERLAERKEAILKKWAQQALEFLPQLRHRRSSSIRDSLPDFIDKMVEALAKGSIESVVKDRMKIAREHGRTRVRQGIFSLDRVMGEYRVFRRCIFEALEESGPLDVLSRDIILELIELAISDAGSVFLRSRFALEQRAREVAEAAARRLEGLQVITEAALTSKVSLDNLLADLCERLRQIFECDTATLLLPEPGKQELIVRATRGESEDKTFLKRRIPFGEGLAGQVMASGVPVLVDDLSKVKLAHDALKMRGVRSVMAVPLRVFDRVVGVAHVGMLKKRRFTEEELSEFSVIAERVGLAIEQARLYEEAIANVTRLEEEKRLRSRFVAALSHDLRTPLTTTRLNLDLLARNATFSEERRRSVLKRAIGSLDRMDHMIQELLDESRVAAGHEVPLKVENFDLKRVAEDVKHEVCAPRNIACRVQGDTVLGFWNKDGIRRVLENLVGNAVKYGDNSFPITIQVDGKRAGEKVLVSVHNMGNPIPDDLRDSLFKPFRRYVPAENGEAKGWGLGLSVVRGTVEAHGGKVSLESSKERGTTFFIELPRDARNIQEKLKRAS